MAFEKLENNISTSMAQLISVNGAFEDFFAYQGEETVWDGVGWRLPTLDNQIASNCRSYEHHRMVAFEKMMAVEGLASELRRINDEDRKTEVSSEMLFTVCDKLNTLKVEYYERVERELKYKESVLKRFAQEEVGQ